jgi:predicted molibdopterin-dependent oxidoreductase YjgC
VGGRRAGQRGVHQARTVDFDKYRESVARYPLERAERDTGVPAHLIRELAHEYARVDLYKCVEACGEDAQNTFAIAVAGRGFDARISTEYDVLLPDSPYCGVGCNLESHVQEDRIVKVTFPLDHDVGLGHLCVKGRFGFEFVQRRARES